MDVDQIVKTQKAEELTVSVLNQLERSRVAYEQERQKDALIFLKGIDSDIALLTAVSERLKNYIQMDSDDHQRLSERLLIIIGNITKAQSNLRDLVTKSQAEIDGHGKRIEENEQVIRDRQREIENLKSEIDSFRKRCEEAEKYFWVPGYGQYLAGRTLFDIIEGKLEQVKRAAQEIQNIDRERQKLGRDTESIKADLSQLEKQVSSNQAEEKALEVQKQLFEQQNKVYAKRIAFTMNMTLYYSQLSESLNGISDNLDNVMRVLRRLDETITHYDIEGKEEKIPLKAALLQLGKDSDYYRPTTGEDVHRIDYGFREKQLGTFLQTSQKEWSESNQEDGKTIHKYIETKRSEWTVHLSDNSRNASLELDVWTNKIYYADSNTPRQEQYQVLSASDRVTGWLAVVVEFGSPDSKPGSFVEVGSKKWSEYNQERNKTSFNFTETGRDEWSVYLYDASRQMSLQLDLWTNKVYCSNPSTPRYQLYTITAAS